MKNGGPPYDHTRAEHDLYWYYPENWRVCRWRSYSRI